jgi:hypothetical protein
MVGVPALEIIQLGPIGLIVAPCFQQGHEPMAVLPDR